MTETSLRPPPQPLRGGGQIPLAPLYPKLLRKIAALIEALDAFERPDPDQQESIAYVALHPSDEFGRGLPIFDWGDDQAEDPPLVGWVVRIDDACHVFVPREGNAGDEEAP